MGFKCRLTLKEGSTHLPLTVEINEWAKELLLERSFEDDGWMLMSKIFEVRCDSDCEFEENKILLQTESTPPPGWEYFVIHAYENEARVLLGIETKAGVQISTDRLGWFF